MPAAPTRGWGDKLNAAATYAGAAGSVLDGFAAYAHSLRRAEAEKLRALGQQNEVGAALNTGLAQFRVRAAGSGFRYNGGNLVSVEAASIQAAREDMKLLELQGRAAAARAKAAGSFSLFAGFASAGLSLAAAGSGGAGA